MRNIIYTSEEIVQFYMSTRKSYSDLYYSERVIIEKIAGLREGNLGNILDVGCACGGLYYALSEKFLFKSYTGVDINEQVIKYAQTNSHFSVPVRFIQGDILRQNFNEKFELIFSLGCADWNIQTDEIIQRCWDLVSDGGYLIITLRTTNNQGINDIIRSYQEIRLSGNHLDHYEKANYVVFNFAESIKVLNSLNPKPTKVFGYGYWGVPSPSAHTPYDKLVFMAYGLQKEREPSNKGANLELTIPFDILI